MSEWFKLDNCARDLRGTGGSGAGPLASWATLWGKLLVDKVAALESENAALKAQVAANAEAVEGWGLLHEIEPDAVIERFHFYRQKGGHQIIYWLVTSSISGTGKDHAKLIDALRAAHD